MRRPAARPPDPAADPLPSKTRRKQTMHELQALGEALVALDPKVAARLALPETLADAIAQARGIRQHEARRRQLQYVGRLMRDVDPAPIRAALAAQGDVGREDKARFAAVEAWRERLLADDAALAEFASAHTGVDRAALAVLVRDARAERAAQRPPHRFRALFRAIARTIAPATPSDSA